MDKVTIDISAYDCKVLLIAFTSSTIDLFEDEINTKAIVSILREFKKKLLTASDAKGIKKVKIHEAWAIFKAIGQCQFSEGSYESNLITNLINKIHKQLI